MPKTRNTARSARAKRQREDRKSLRRKDRERALQIATVTRLMQAQQRLSREIVEERLRAALAVVRDCEQRLAAMLKQVRSQRAAIRSAALIAERGKTTEPRKRGRPRKARE